MVAMPLIIFALRHTLFHNSVFVLDAFSNGSIV